MCEDEKEPAALSAPLTLEPVEVHRLCHSVVANVKRLERREDLGTEKQQRGAWI